MKIKITEIEWIDTGCPTCGGFDGKYPYEEPPEELVVEVADTFDLNNPDTSGISELADLPYQISECKVELLP